MNRLYAAFAAATLVAGAHSALPAHAEQTDSIAAASNGRWHVIDRVSVSSTGGEAGELSEIPSISGDGRFIAFASPASDLVAGDSNGQHDVFVHDRFSGATERMSVSSTGAEANAGSWFLSISGDGRYVSFQSYATNLVAGDTNYSPDVFVHDRVAGTTERVSVSSTGLQADGWSEQSSMSGDGRYVAFSSLASNLVTGDTQYSNDVFVRDRVAGTTERVSVSSAGTPANGASTHPSMSDDGRYVAFESPATNLVAADTNGLVDVFVRDRLLGVTERVSVSSDGVEADSHCQYASISSDGRYVAFMTAASNLVDGDTNGVGDVFVRDRLLAVTERVSVSSAGIEANAENWFPSVSGDGRYVSFQSYASNLVDGDTNGVSDIFVRDRVSGTTERVSVTSTGAQANNDSEHSSLSNDGRHVAFESAASNLEVGDLNGQIDVFVAGRSIFADTADSVFEADIGWLASEGITKGCNPPENTYYCPNDNVTRGQMAAFLARALHLVDSGGDPFTDDDGSVFEGDISRLAAVGITKGCNPPLNDMFCPLEEVTRGQMAAFLVRALGYTDDGGGNLFTDDDGDIFESSVDRLAAAGVTKGCNPPTNDKYCPGNNVTRGQMAAFLHRALG